MKPHRGSGKLRRWNDDRGFGFIKPVDGSKEVFLHISELKISELKDTTRRPQENDTIYYDCTVDSDGKFRACNAYILGAKNKSISSSMSSRRNAKHRSRFASNFPLFKVLALSILPFIGIVHFTFTTHNPLPLILYPVMSLVTYKLYADDKSRAKRKDRRTPEKTLHLCELTGGWLGGFIAQQKLRHKSKKGSYQAVFWAIVILHYITWLFWLFWGKML